MQSSLSSPNSSNPASATLKPLAIVTSLFFMWGFITCMNDLLIPKFKTDFDLTQFQANLVQSAFFGAYFFVSLGYFLISALKGDPINKIGYQKGVVVGLLIAGLGCFLFYPAAETKQYALFLGALLILGSGVTIVQIAANPYVSILGPEKSAAARLNLSQGLNSLGYVVAPLIGGLMLFGGHVYEADGGMQSVQRPYLGLGAAFVLLALIFNWVKLPSFVNTDKIERGIQVFKYPHFVWGWFAIFFYVGSEVAVGSILINFLGDSSVLGLEPHHADKYLSFYWGGLMIGRLMGALALSEISGLKKSVFMAIAAIISFAIIFGNATFKQHLTSGEFISFSTVTPFLGLILLNFIFFHIWRNRPGRMVGLFALVATLMTCLAMFLPGQWALWSLIGIGLFNSIMWSNIFTLSIKGLGKNTSQGSSLLVMMIVGGAILPVAQGALMDSIGVRLSLSVVIFGYLYLVFYGFIGSKIGLKANTSEE